MTRVFAALVGVAYLGFVPMTFFAPTLLPEVGPLVLPALLAPILWGVGHWRWRWHDASPALMSIAGVIGGLIWIAAFWLMFAPLAVLPGAMLAASILIWWTDRSVAAVLPELPNQSW